MRSIGILFIVCAVLLSCSRTPEITTQAETISFTRYFTTTVCDSKNNCIGPTVKDIENSQVVLHLRPFRKGGKNGATAADENRLMEEGIPFISGIRITRDDRNDEYYVHMMLRSGASTARNGVIKTFTLKDFADLQQVTISDKPIKVNDKTVKVDLVLDSAIEITQ